MFITRPYVDEWKVVEGPTKFFPATAYNCGVEQLDTVSWGLMSIVDGHQSMALYN